MISYNFYIHHPMPESPTASSFEALQKSQKLESLTADREKLREIRKVAHREAERILRDAKREVQRQAVSSRRVRDERCSHYT